jgi:hypothetical protein
MLKITVRPGQRETKMILEGDLAGAWVNELEQVWTTQEHPADVDLSGVTFISDEGKQLLSKMCREGARFHASGVMNKCIVMEIRSNARTRCIPGARPAV